MVRFKVPPAANDEGRAPQIRVEGLDSPPLTVTEVEIFDALISNIGVLTAANDNNASPTKEKLP